MNRVVSLLSLLMIIGGFIYAWSSGALMDVIDPKVSVVVVSTDIQEGLPLRASSFEIAQVPLSNIKTGNITVPAGADKMDVMEELSLSVTKRSISKGSRLSVQDLADKDGIFVMRAISDIQEGTKLERSNVMVVLGTGDVADGAVVFRNVAGAHSQYLTNQVLTATSRIASGDIVRLEDVSGGAGSVYVMIANENKESGDPLSVEDVSIVAMPTVEMPRGAISFPSKTAGDVFISTSGGLRASRNLDVGEVLVVSSIAKTFGSTLSDGILPLTLREYLDFEARYPDATMLVDDEILVGSEASDGTAVDVWIETGATDGPYGTVKIRKIHDDLKLLRITELVEVDNEITEEFRHWVNTGRETFKAIEEARRTGRIAFMIDSKTGISDFIGNGAVCVEGLCSVSKTASRNLENVRFSFNEDGTLIEGTQDALNDPLTVMDGVDAELERILVSNGYSTFRDIARLEDRSLRLVAFNLQVSENLVVYIRQQAINLISNAERSRRDIGLTDDELAD